MRYILCLLFILSSCSIFVCTPYPKEKSALSAIEQPILKKPVHFQDPAVASNTASASAQADFAPAVFPNYFSFIPKAKALALIDKSIASVLSRLQIPYIDPARPTKADGTPNIQKEGFFITLEGMIHAKDPGAKVYISGGVVRSILGYIYKKLYHEHQRALAEAVNRADVDMEALVRDTFDRMIDGRSRKSTNNDDALLEIYQVDQDVDMLTALGIGSDLDILVKFSAGFKGDKKRVMCQTTDFINSAEHALGLHDDKSSLKKSIVPIGDVKDYDTQVGTDRSDKNAVAQGGSSLDWLAFPVSAASGRSMVMPSDYQEIMDHFLKGELDYIPSPQQPTPDKQTIRGLRSLLELPFLNYTANGFQAIKAELEALIAKGSLESLAQEQIGKMIRNARFEGAKNRFASSIPGMSAETIEGLVHQLSEKNRKTKIPQFMVKNDPALRYGTDKGGLAKAKILIPVDTFIENYTDQGVLYHGTPDFTNVLNMIRNGMVISKQNQGTAIHGRGVYTDKTRSVPESYAKDTGVVLEMKVQPDGLRVLDWATAKKRQELKTLFPDAATASGAELDTIFETLSQNYDIDIIINQFPLIQNAAAIRLPKKSIDLIKLQIQQAENSLKAYLATEEKPAIGAKQIRQWFNYLHPKGQFAGFAHVIGIQLTKDMHARVNRALPAYLAQDDADAEIVCSMILSHGKNYWKTEEEQLVYEAAFKVYKKFLNTIAAFTLDDALTNDFIFVRTTLKQDINASNISNYISALRDTPLDENMRNDLEYLHTTFKLDINFANIRAYLSALREKPLDENMRNGLEYLHTTLKQDINAYTINKIVTVLSPIKGNLITYLTKAMSLRQDLNYIGEIIDIINAINTVSEARLDDFILFLKEGFKGALVNNIVEVAVIIKNIDLQSLQDTIKNILPNLENDRYGLAQVIIKLHKKFKDEWLDYFKKLKIFIVGGKSAYADSILDSLLAFLSWDDVYKETEMILEILKKEKSNNLSYANILKALSKHQQKNNKKEALDLTAELIKMTPNKTKLTYMLYTFLTFDIEKMHKIIEALPAYLSSLDQATIDNLTGQGMQEYFQTY